MPPDMQRAMAVEAETSREAKAKVSTLCLPVCSLRALGPGLDKQDL